MSPSLEAKLAAVLDYCDDLRSRRRIPDDRALDSFLDDAEVAEWLHAQRKAGIAPSRFIARSQYGR